MPACLKDGRVLRGLGMQHFTFLASLQGEKATATELGDNAIIGVSGRRAAVGGRAVTAGKGNGYGLGYATVYN